MLKVAVWVGLFASTALLDFLAARWADAATPTRRANLSALHEAVGFVTGFAVFSVYRDLAMAVPCVLGAWVGSRFAGVREGVDPALLEAVHEALEIIQAKGEREAK